MGGGVAVINARPIVDSWLVYRVYAYVSQSFLNEHVDFTYQVLFPLAYDTSRVTSAQTSISTTVAKDAAPTANDELHRAPV